MRLCVCNLREFMYAKFCMCRVITYLCTYWSWCVVLFLAVCFGIKHPSGAYDQIFITVRQLRVCWCRALSLTRGRVCHLQLLLALASTVIFGSESPGTRDHNLLSQIRDFPFHRFLRLAGLRWRYSTPPPHGSSFYWVGLVLLFIMCFCRYLLFNFYITSTIVLWVSMCVSFICNPCLLVLHIWYISSVFSCLPFFSVFDTFIMFVVLQYACPMFNTWFEYTELPFLFLIACKRSLYLVWNVRPVCLLYFSEQSIHLIWYTPLFHTHLFAGTS
jgi:hypothetical protein